MKKQTPPMEIDIHLLDLRYAHTRIKNAAALAKMQNSIIRYGQIVPALAVPENNNFILIDGYLRLKALKACGHDCIKLQVIEASEADSLFVMLAKNNDRQWRSNRAGSLNPGTSQPFHLFIWRDSQTIGQG